MKFLKIFILLIPIIIISGCNSTDDQDNFLSNLQQSKNQQNFQSYKDGSVMIPSPIASFAEDLKFYDIPTLEELALMNKQSIKKAKDDDDGEKKSEDGEKKSEDEDDNSDEDEEKQDDANNEKNNSSSKNDDGSDDDSDDDSGNDSSSSTSSSKTTINLQDYTKLGGFKVILNNKSYQFVVIQDNYAQIKEATPKIVKNSDGSFTLYVNAYVMQNNNVNFKAGVFTLKLVLPSLNISGYFPIEQNVLTANSDTQVVGYVTIVSPKSNIHEFSVGIAVDEFNVLNRKRDTVFKAKFDLGFATSGMQAVQK